VTTSETVVAEVVYVLSSRSLYNLGHEDIAARLRPLLALIGLKLSYKRSCLQALGIYAGNPHLDFEDALSVAHMERQNIEEIISYDTDFDRIPSVRRVEP